MKLTFSLIMLLDMGLALPYVITDDLPSLNNSGRITLNQSDGKPDLTYPDVPYLHNDTLTTHNDRDLDANLPHPYNGNATIIAQQKRDAHEDLKSEIRRISFDIKIHEFERIRPDPPPLARTLDELDWNSDACTLLVDRPASYDFKGCCQRNDFAILNLSNQGMYNRCTKQRVKDTLRIDLNSICDSSQDLGSIFCRFWATLYHLGLMATQLGKGNGPCLPGEEDQPAA